MEDIKEDTWIIVYGKVIDDDGLKLKVVDYENVLSLRRDFERRLISACYFHLNLLLLKLN